MVWTKFNTFKKEIAGKKVLILGLGLQGGGVGAVKFFNEMKCRLRVTDLKKENILRKSLDEISKVAVESFTLGENKTTDIDWADIVLLNPGVPHDADIVRYAKQRNKTIYMEEALFTSLCPVSTIGVTGTRGKTTTTALIGELLKTKFPVLLAGNIAGSETLQLLFEIKSNDQKIVMELSSFQLFGFHLLKVSPEVAVITNIYEDHLNVYKSMDEYVYDKKAVYLYQGKKAYSDYLVINNNLLKRNDGIGSNPFFKDFWAFDKKIHVRAFQSTDVDGDEMSLNGDHNKENFAAAKSVAGIFEISKENIAMTFKSFQGVPFRQEKIREYKGVVFINDTTASTPTAAVKAIEAFPKGKTVLLAGGNSKNCNISEFAKSIAKNCKKVIFIKGNATENLRDEIRLNQMKEEDMSKTFDKFEEAVNFAFSQSAPGDVLLLSPGFTSFGEFNNEFERGKMFNQIVGDLK